MIALTVLVVGEVLLARINILLCAALIALVWVGLYYFSYSQSSVDPGSLRRLDDPASRPSPAVVAPGA